MFGSSFHIPMKTLILFIFIAVCYSTECLCTVNEAMPILITLVASNFLCSTLCNNEQPSPFFLYQTVICIGHGSKYFTCVHSFIQPAQKSSEVKITIIPTLQIRTWKLRLTRPRCHSMSVIWQLFFSSTCF